MRFLIDADMPRRTAGLLKTYGHEAVDVRDVGLGGTSDQEVAEYGRVNRMCLLTGDFGFADIRNYPGRSAPSASATPTAIPGLVPQPCPPA
jgi:predicted nuclease of predicted toxin-antitoxin system